MKKQLTIFLLSILGLIITTGVIIDRKHKQINDLKHEVDQKEDEISDLKKEKEELDSKVSDLEDEIASLEKKSEESDYTSQQNYPYSNLSVNPGSSYTFQNRSYPIANGAGATVVYRKSGCDYFILENSQGYIVGEWMGGHDPDEGEVLYGSFNSFGTKTFSNSSNSESSLWIEDYWLSKEDALEKINDECN